MNTVRIWLADIRRLEGREEALLSLLPPGRKETALRAAPGDRLHCIAAGLLLRDVLGVERDEDLRLNPYGKPELSSGCPCFNLSHGGNYAVLAVSDAPVGVDIEPVGEKLPISIPRRFLRPDELAWLGEKPSPERFARLWTRLESALKADGSGLAMKHRAFSVLEEGAPWHLHTFTHEDHVISCAAGEPFDIQWNQWAEDI